MVQTKYGVVAERYTDEEFRSWLDNQKATLAKEARGTVRLSVAAV